ncbi:MAG TPA: thioesterase family protein [Actinomycetales bacterium]|nr:thioesterase family protein [Actinomycetales bacterium]
MALSFYEPDDGPAHADGSADPEPPSGVDGPTDADVGTRWRATEATEGPWSPALQHGGPPSALLVRAAERAARRHTGRDDLQALRVVVDFLGPVPVGVVAARAQVLRAGRSAVLVESELSTSERTALRATTWLVREATEPTPTAAPASEPSPPDPDALPDDDTWDFGYARHVRWRRASGTLRGQGPASVWMSPSVPLVPGEPLTGLQRLVTVADSASGVSAQLDWGRWSFPNVDLTVHLARRPQGSWLLLDARTRLEPAGNGLAEAVLHDRRGPVGRSAQTLVVGPLQ